MIIKVKYFFYLAILFAWGCSDDSLEVANVDSGESSTFVYNNEGYNEDRNLYFGDTHVHTKYSFDAYIFGTTATPDDAYNFAQGGAIKHPLGFDMQLSEPLDFYAVTDHGFFLGTF